MQNVSSMFCYVIAVNWGKADTFSSKLEAHLESSPAADWTGFELYIIAYWENVVLV